MLLKEEKADRLRRIWSTGICQEVGVAVSKQNGQWSCH